MGSREKKIAIRIDPAIERDVPAVLRLIKGLAEYERLTHKVVATETGLHAALFGPRPVAEAILARVSAEPVGFAVFFPTFSTFAGRPNMYLEDLYVELPWRRKGVGRRLIARVARIAAARGWSQMSWSVLDWNEPALDFYRSLGAEPVTEWVGYRIGGEAFSRLAQMSVE
jgi:GNAT superfamily N-acetyltransferase